MKGKERVPSRTGHARQPTAFHLSIGAKADSPGMSRVVLILVNNHLLGEIQLNGEVLRPHRSSLAELLKLVKNNRMLLARLSDT